MAREIQRHSTRLSQVHEAAQEFTPGQRVQTIDGHPGRVLLITGSIAPGITEYQVLLDQGGTHTYTASQLRPIPDAYAGATHPIPPGLLPAGVQVPEFRPMAAFITEDQAREAAQLHLASDDYPEMGEVLHDRPDPGAVIKVIGRRHEHDEARASGAPLRKLAADRYRDEDDPRDEDYNGGEEGADIRWAQPGQQDWMHENVGPQEQVPLQEEAEVLPGPIARLLQQEAAARLFYGTTINGTQIDDAGDAPQHGTIPRAENPDGYDDQSTEGQGDDKWNQPVSGDADKKTLNGASVAMYPEGVSSGDGPGISVGPFVANVPWTGEQRGHLHSWDNGSSAQAGDFVSSRNFTNKVPVTQEIEDPAQEIIEQDLRAQAALWEMPQGEDVVNHLLSHHGFYDDEIGAEGVTPEDQHTFAHTERDPRDFQFAGVPHIHTGPYVNNTAPWAGTDRPVARELEHERPWARGRVMHTLSSQRLAVSEHDWLAHLIQRHGYTPEHLQDLIDKGTKPSHFHEALHEAGLADGHMHEVSYGTPFPPVPPESGGIQGGDPGDAIASSKPGHVKDPATWSDQQRRRYLSAREAGVRVQVHGPNDFSLHQAPDEHGDPDNDLDTPTGKDKAPKADTEDDANSLDAADVQAMAPADQDDSLDAPEAGPGDQPGTVPADGAAPEPNASLTGPDAETEGGRALPPTAWPMTQAPVQQGGPAYTQGTHDQHGRVFPPPPPAPAPTGEDGSPIGEDGEEPGEEGGGGKKVQLEIKTAGEDSADRMRRLYHEHLDETGREHERRMHEQDFEAEQGWEHRPLPNEHSMQVRERGGGHYRDADIGTILGTEPVHARGEDEWNERERRVYSGSLALAHFTAAAGSAAFRFEFTASWSDVVAKAKRIRKSGRVRITHSSPGMVIGEVGGDHDVYETGIQRVAGHPQTIQHWACGCPWGSFRQDKSLPGRLNGRPCSHTMALQFEALSRTNRHKKVDQDLSAADLGVPHQVVVKSMPPWTNGGWARTWLAPAASLHEASVDGTECYYQHPGRCPDPGRTGESLHHARPKDFHSEIGPNPQHNPDGWWPHQLASHLMTGYLGGTPAGKLHFSVSDDGQAYEVGMLHSKAPGKGVGAALMDDLYSHVKQHGRWIDHGVRTDEGNNWWSTYREPHPELNTHRNHPKQGWEQYWSPAQVGLEAKQNYRKSGGRGEHTMPLGYTPGRYDADPRDEQWMHARGMTDKQLIARGLVEPAKEATAALLREGGALADIVALGQLAGWSVTADQTNAPWGSENVTRHPPVKPYGATEPPNPDQSPASYGFLSAPDPDNWGSIQEDSAMQMPLTNTAAAQSQVFSYTAPGHEDHGGLSVWLSHDWDDLPRCVGCGHRERHPVTGVPPRQTRESGPKAIAMELPNRQRAMRATALSDPGHKVLVPGAPAPLPAGLNYPSIVDQNDQGTFNYTDRANTAGPSTAMEPRDPQGIRMEEACRTADITGEIPQLDGALAELHDEPEPALAEDGLTAEGVSMGDQGIEEGLTGGAQIPSPVTQNPGPGSLDEYLTPQDSSIQTIGMGEGTDSDEVTVPADQPQGDTDSVVAAFQRSAAARQYGEGGSPASGLGNGDIAQAARAFLKTADVLPDHEAAELIAEGRGERARNLGLLRLEGTHYEDEDADLARRGLSLDDYDDDVVSA